MSFGFSISDFKTVGELAYKLYRDCYLVARGAPQEFQLLLSETSNLANSLKILREEAEDPGSVLAQAGEDRVRMVNEMVKGIEHTLKKLEKAVINYGVLDSGSKNKHSWATIWSKIKWSLDFADLDALRSKGRMPIDWKSAVLHRS